MLPSEAGIAAIPETITDTQQIAYSFTWCLLCVPYGGVWAKNGNGIKDLSSFIQVELGAGGSPLEGQKGSLSMVIAPLVVREE